MTSHASSSPAVAGGVRGVAGSPQRVAACGRPDRPSARLSARLSGANEVPPITGAASDSAETSLNPSNPVRTWIHAAAHPGAEICGQVTLRQ